MALEYFRQVQVFIGKHLDPQASALAFAAEVRGRLDEMVARNEVPGRYQHFVDGREGAPFESVRPGGTIAASFTYNAEVLAYALAFLHRRSPTGPMPRSGPRLYRKPFRESFWVSIAGKYIRPGELNLQHVPGGPVELIIGNVQPYARKVNTQRIGKRQMQFNAPPYLFKDAARAINAQFGNLVRAHDVHDIQFPEKYRLLDTQMRTGERRFNVKRWAGTFVESPALIINPR